MRKCLVIELQMERLNVDLGMNEDVRHNRVRWSYFLLHFEVLKEAIPENIP